MKVHEKIRFLRREKNLTQEEMAEKLGMSPVSYGKIERGEVDYIAKLEKVANALEVDLVELMYSGERHIYQITGDNSTNGGFNVMISSATELAFEIQKLQLIIQHDKEMLAQKDKDIERLETIIELMKKTNPTG
jgi:transcriptional regulator with XRE-family HTH domain